MKKTSRTKEEPSEELTNVLPQEQLSTQEDTKSQVTAVIKLTDKWLTKTPENSDQLAFYTQHKIDELFSKNGSYKPDDKINWCVFCEKKTHNVTMCKELKEYSLDMLAANQRCCICECDHDMLKCKWPQLLDTTHSLNQENQQKLCQVCPYLQGSIENPDKRILFKFSWEKVKSEVEKIDTTQFRFPYFEIPQTTDQNTACKLKTNKEEDTVNKPEKLLIKIPTNSDQLVLYTQQKIDEMITKNEICLPENEISFCVHCRVNTHNVTNCSRIKGKSEQRNKETITECSMCRGEHEIIACKWLHVLNIAHSLNAEHQKKLFKICPYLEKSVNRPYSYMFFEFTWFALKQFVERMDPCNFRFPYFKKPKVQMRQKPIEISHKKMSMSQQKQDSKLCYFCRSSEHYVRSCVLLKQSKIKRKNRRSENERAKLILQQVSSGSPDTDCPQGEQSWSKFNQSELVTLFEKDHRPGQQLYNQTNFAAETETRVVCCVGCINSTNRQVKCSVKYVDVPSWGCERTPENCLFRTVSNRETKTVPGIPVLAQSKI